MIKSYFYSLTLLFSASIYADASIDMQNREKTYLLVAPGTLSHKVQNPQKSALTSDNTDDSERKVFKVPPHRFVADDYFKFHQYGQMRGQNNPWIDEEYQRLPKRQRRHTTVNYTNPWYLGGAHPPELESFQSNYFPTMGNMVQPDSFGGMTDNFSAYTDGIYRDTNPAAFGRGFNSGLLPGLGGDDFHFPFLPF